MRRECRAIGRLKEWCSPKTIVMGGVGPGLEVPLMHDAWPDARIIGVEPLQEACDKLSPNIRKCFDKIVCAALWSEDVQLSMLHRKGARRSQSAAVAELYSRHTDYEVRGITLRTLEEMTFSWRRVLLWLDVEGTELRVMSGPRITNPHWCNLELSWTPDADCPAGWEVEQCMLQQGYHLAYVHSVMRNCTAGDGFFIRRSEWRRMARRLRKRTLARYNGTNF